MNPVKLYLSTFENTKGWYNDMVEDKKKTVVLASFSFINKIDNKFVKNLFWYCCSIAEPFVSLIIVCCQLPVFFFKALFAKKQKVKGDLFLYFTPLLPARTKSAGLFDSSQYWLFQATTKTTDFFPEKQCYRVFNNINTLQVLSSFILSIISIFAATAINRFTIIFRNYVSFEFFLTYYYLKNTPEETRLFFGNQIDRWVTLFDLAQQKEKVLVQHGIERTPCVNKMKNTRTAYVLSKTEGEMLTKYIFDKPPVIHLMAPTISFYAPNEEEQLKVLIIGYPEYVMFKEEQYVIKELQSPDIMVYLKTHPGHESLLAYEDLQKQYKFTLITEQKFPQVDYVVSYESTLAVEYEVHGIPVLKYEENKLIDIVDFIKKSQK